MQESSRGTDATAATAESRPAPPAGRTIAVGGSVAALVAAAFVAASLAIPSGGSRRELQGPFVGPLTAEKVQVNLADGRSFLVLQLNVLYEAYSRDYFEARSDDPVCDAEVRDVLVALASSRSREQVTSEADKPVFAEEIRRAVEPLFFPVHVGDAEQPGERDSRSGLGPGASRARATFRGLAREHALAIDAPARTLRLDRGAPVTYTGDERDLALAASDGTTLYLDVTRVDPEFRGEVAVGVHGRVQKVLWSEILIQ
jgi:flagellar basal body-associated protein FliL